ncbi:MAG: helix-turn-helix domain-containing protein [Corynebacterium sp.]|uniref:helix-turn-helix domain-containing protein n=1 Tax=Corynebacterium TaxID=1716 RepID=UPI0026494B48|nr:helix-turn-helix domain-containing protein [Corynebacterium sp.]MDN5722096.1 helix-turn-helix domain-containing protein [Corynebacterium sp.]MDN6282287.1 helix-turn-helix domain-containing protein [Corynebacterium sp.]MDN6304638.1 helix-turn-helix domain-containing protein [Corynebacterium sp.]MDN6352164.1 helix-turn-helix domain-containing protein [Corynebacterium sp.]MDN6368093.1 helix-turn-helix domain-containing protein [Corynebacterium sp.]
MSNTLRDLRQSASLTQSELARRSGVAQPNIAAYESGRRQPSEQMLERLQLAARPLPHEALATHRDELLELAQSYGLSNVRVFGSAARGADHPGSDLDLLATLPSGMGLLALAGFVEDANELLDVDVDIVSDDDLRPGHPITTTAVDL